MSIDKSLRSRSALSRHRSVLTRAERIERLEEEERWTEDDGVLGLPKVRNLRAKRSRGKSAEAETDEAAEAGAETAAEAEPQDES